MFGIIRSFYFVAFCILFFVGNQQMIAEVATQLPLSEPGDMTIMPPEKKSQEKDRLVVKKVLPNGMTVLVRVIHTIPKVSIQMWYNVGSRDERDGEKGIAHLIEHMIFKGTEKLSESDIDVIVHKLSGSSNAFTTLDFTGYKFNMPTHHWKKILPVIADCMVNASFKDEHLNSEMKAVIQELKMINDQHLRSLAFDLLGLMFAGHPYHYPLIGYKQDLWSVRGADLRAFYKKHYMPNNATLVVVGDVDHEEVFAVAEQQFGSISGDGNYKKQEAYLNEDVASRSLTMYRDVKVPIVMESFRVPGLKAKASHVMDIAALVLGQGKSSRLYKKLVDELQLVTSVGAMSWNMFDHGIFFINFEPKKIEDINKIETIIFNEINDIVANGLKQDELIRATKQAQMAYYSKLEDAEQQAFDIGRCFIATGDEEYALNYLDVPDKQMQKDLQSILGDFFRQTVLHRGMVLPLPEHEKKQWEKLQIASDELDNKILSTRIRTTQVEEPRYAKTVSIEEPGVFVFPKPEIFELSNGVKVFHSHNNNTPKIDLVLSFKAKGYHDPQDKQGLYNFVAKMLTEGTKNYTAAELADAIESRGMSFSAAPGAVFMSMLSADLEKGLEILEEILSRATFDKREMEKVRAQILTSIKDFWDTPFAFSSQLIKERVYAGHPYSQNSLGDEKSVSSVTQEDLQHFYKSYISPSGARLAIVGDLSGYDVQAILEKKLAKWNGPEVPSIEFPKIKQPKVEVVDHYINRDQVVLCFAGLSVDRKHEDYDKLWLFDQIFWRRRIALRNFSSEAITGAVGSFLCCWRSVDVRCK
ncbi:M16 family metallopeptidase [Candidatus Dependentiae bacterium]